METTISENLIMSFGVLTEGSNDELTIKQLAVDPEIWDEQCGDDESRDQVQNGSFAGVTAAVFRLGAHALGYILFVPRPDGLYEQHTAFLVHSRGPIALKCIQAALTDLFLTTPCIGVLTQCPDWNPGSRHLAHKVGGIMVSKIPKFKVREGRMQGATLYQLPLWTWACEHHDEFEAQGEAWHDKVFQTLDPHHEDDTAHNGWLGLAIEMGKMQPQKAMDVYNSWAVKAAYAPGKLLWADGAGASLIDIFDAAVLNTRDGNVVVIPRCPPPQPLPQSSERASRSQAE